MKIKKYVKLIESENRKMKLFVYDSRKNNNKKVPCLVWFHGGGFLIGSGSWVKYSRAMDLLKSMELVVISPDYTLSLKKTYPAALNDSYNTLIYIKNNHFQFGIDINKLMIGGESAGGGLTLATAIYLRNKKEIDIKLMFPLYPMIDCDETNSSKNNHTFIWNTRKNNYAWKKYLGDIYETNRITEYASPAKLKNYKGLPPFYTFVSKYEPFYDETKTFVNNSKKASIDARIDIYKSHVHAFDILCPWTKASKDSKKNFKKNALKMIKKYL